MKLRKILITIIVVLLVFLASVLTLKYTGVINPSSPENVVETNSPSASDNGNKSSQSTAPATASATASAAASEAATATPSSAATAAPAEATATPDSEDPQQYRESGEIPPGFGSLTSEESSRSLSNNEHLSFYAKSSTSLSNILMSDTLSGSNLSHDDRFADYIKEAGIDVSQFQGDIDWSQVAASGVKFAIIRVGYRGYSTGRMVEDPKFYANMDGAIKNGIQVGVYFFSMAVNETEAAEEAQFALNRVANYSLSLPIYMDTEFSGDPNGDRLIDANLSKQQETNIVLTFCNTIKSAGRRAGEYANKTYLENNVDSAQIIANGHKIWLANWTTKTDYTGDYDVWQHCGTNGQVSIPGISGYVDCNIWYVHSSVYKGVDYSAVYDYNYYLQENPDVHQVYGDNSEEGVIAHFVNTGMSEGRIAKATFDVHSYKNAYADLRNVFGNNWASYFWHYLHFGQYENRTLLTGINKILNPVTVYNGVDYSAVYDFDYYLQQNQDVAAAFGSSNDSMALWHFVNYGMSEGRLAKSTFDVHSYRNAYADLRNAYGSDMRAYFMHYIIYGQHENRSLVTGVSTIMGGVTVYNGTNYAAVYDFNYYLQQNPDVAAAFGSGNDTMALWHFVNYGMSEGRIAKDTFNVYVYRNTYDDLRNAYGSDMRAYYMHYIIYGQYENRITK